MTSTTYPGPWPEPGAHDSVDTTQPLPAPVGPPLDLDLRLAKTSAGRHEIRERSLPLSRAARNLLLIIDATQDASHWLRLVRGCAPADLQTLVDAGLVSPETRAAPAPVGDAARAAAALPGTASAPAQAAVARPAAESDIAQALRAVGYTALYDRLNAEVRPRLGLMQGYRITLAVERAADLDALCAVALQFITQVRESQGEAQARHLLRLLVTGAGRQSGA